MTYDFTNEHGEEFAMNTAMFNRLFHLGKAFGWTPQPTTRTINGVLDWQWDGSYFGNDSQWVNAECAMEWSYALERAFIQIPDQWRKFDGEDDAIENIKATMCRLSGEGKEWLRDWIEFLKRGAFKIW